MSYPRVVKLYSEKQKRRSRKIRTIKLTAKKPFCNLLYIGTKLSDFNNKEHSFFVTGFRYTVQKHI